MATEPEKQDDTTKVETPEQAPVSTDTEVTPQGETEPKEEMVSKTELEKLQKEKEQVELRKNQLENQLQKAVDAGNSEEVTKVLDELKAENEALKAEKEREQLESQVKEFETEMETVFEKELENYPEEIKVVARLVKNKSGIGTVIGEVQYGFQAEKNIKTFLKDLSDGLKETSRPNIQVDATNPSITPAKSEKDLLEELKKTPEKERDYSKILAKRLGKRT